MKKSSITIPMLSVIAVSGLVWVTPAVSQSADWVLPGSRPATAASPAAATAPSPAASPNTPTEQRPASAQPAASTTPAGATDEFTDTSEQVLLADRALADAIFDQGPLAAYRASISPSGVIYDGNGGAPEGEAGITQRFSSFPDGVKLDRRPTAAVASGSAGSSWGTYAVRRGDQVLTEGHYLTSWRREANGWRIVTELAAGKSLAPAASGTLPRAPDGPRPANRRPAATPGAAPAAAPAAARPQGAPSASGSAPEVVIQRPSAPMRDALGRPVTTLPTRPPASTPPATTPPTAAPSN